MAQSSPDWSMILLGGSGFLGFMTLVTKGIVDQKEEQVKYLTKRNQDLEADAKEAREKSLNLVTELERLATSIDKSCLSSEDLVRLQKILEILGEFEELPAAFDDCKHAAQWLLARKKIWAQQGCELARQKYRSMLPRNKVKYFKEDIEQYLSLLYTCLYKYGHTRNTSLSDFVKIPVIQASHPYLAAIDHIIDLSDWGELTPIQRAYLREALIQLTRKIRDEF